MGDIGPEASPGLPADSKGVDVMFWQSLLAGMAMGQILLAIMFYMTSSQKP
ncbi:hypothetical protein Emag_004693 [Eimeria magna]